MAPGLPRLHAISTYLSKNLIYFFIRVFTLERFHIVTQNYTASFSIKTRFCETKNIFYFKN